MSDNKPAPDATVDFDDPAHRTGAAIYLVLKQQLARLGFAPGAVPVDERFASERCRGALLGTAAAIVRGHYPAPGPDNYRDAVGAAFAVVFGEQAGPELAQQTIEESANGNAVVNLASSWAGKDTQERWQAGSDAPPMAFHQAATEGR